MGAMLARAVGLGALLTASAACVPRTPGVTRTSADNLLVTIVAGQAEFGPLASMPAWYLIDKRTQTCWMYFDKAAAQLDCCLLRRVSEAQPYITWTNCSGDVPRSPAITPGAAAPAASPDWH